MHDLLCTIPSVNAQRLVLTLREGCERNRPLQAEAVAVPVKGSKLHQEGMQDLQGQGQGEKK